VLEINNHKDIINKVNILTGDRPTGKLHLGHYIGSLKRRLELQEDDKNNMYIMIADIQALTDNFNNPSKIKDSVLEIILDYLAVGLDPYKITIFIQSQISALAELTIYYMNLVSVARVQRNPTLKEEIKQKGFTDSIPVGFFCYPISQAADITAFNASIVPVGEDQLPMLEQTREIVRTFNSIYGDTLVEPIALLPSNRAGNRLPGTDGKSKMSKSFDNCIYLSDESDEITKKVMSMYTDPNHLKIDDPGEVENNPVFIYLDAFCTDRKTFKDMCEHYKKGGLGDIKVKKYLNDVLQEELAPIRKRRNEYKENIDYIYSVLKNGYEFANQTANKTLEGVKNAIGIDFSFKEKN